MQAGVSLGRGKRLGAITGFGPVEELRKIVAAEASTTPRLKGLRAFGAAVRDFVIRDIWRLDLSKLTRLEGMLVQGAKILIFVARQFVSDKLLMRSAALTYSSLLAIVPLLAVVFSVLKGFGLHVNLRDPLSEFLSPLGPRGEIISGKIMEFVSNAQTGALGTVGFLVLLVTVVNILNNIETSYNEIWHVDRGRSWDRRLMNYFALILIGPLLLVLVLGATASVASSEIARGIFSARVLSTVGGLGLKTVPYVVGAVAFAVVTLLVPNARVRVGPALTAGCVSSLLWQLSNWAFASFMVSASRASPREILFAGFAALPLFLVWLYWGWVVVLLGAELAYVIQYVGVMEWRELEKHYGESLRLYGVLLAAAHVVREFTLGHGAARLDRLSRRVQIPVPVMRDLLKPLVEKNVLVKAEAQDAYLPARDPDSLMVAEVISAFGGDTTLPPKLAAGGGLRPQVAGLLERLNDTLRAAAGGLSLKQLALEAVKPPGAASIGAADP